MNIPQVNAGATDRNRYQTQTICELRGWLVDAEAYRGPVVVGSPAKELNERGERISQVVDLPNGSFTLDQVVGMMRERGWRFTPRDVCTYKGGYWMKRRADMVWEDMGYVKDAHSLTQNMDSLIKMLEKPMPWIQIYDICSLIAMSILCGASLTMSIMVEEYDWMWFLAAGSCMLGICYFCSRIAEHD